MKHTLRIIISLTGLLIFAAGADAATFGTVQSYAAAGGLGQSATADFNGDGVPDIAVVSCVAATCNTAAPATIAVLIANGDGSFQAPVSYLTGSFQPMSVAAGDVNGDGFADLVVASVCPTSATCGTGQVSVFLGNGDGTFKSPVPYNTGNGGSYFVAMGDFNGDGYPDLAVCNQTAADSVIAILLGNGDGTFQSPMAYSTGAPSAVYLAVGDFNNDGSVDLAVANANAEDTVSVLLGNGDGSLQAPMIYAAGGAYLTAVAIGDFNSDGSLDLAVVNSCASFIQSCSQSGSIGILLGNGDGTFKPAVSYGSGGNEPNSVTVADFDGDGVLDLAVSNLSSSSGGSAAGAVSLLSGNGDGTFQPASTFATGGNYASAILSGDFNADGQPDLAVVNQCATTGGCSSGVIGVLLNTTAKFGSYATTTSLTSLPNPSATSQAVLLTASLAAAFDAATVSGNVTFYDGTAVLSTAAVSNGQASYTASFATVGLHALRAVYSADSHYAASSSNTVAETIGTKVTVTSSLNPSALNQAVTFTATVAGTGSTPTGTVTFKDGTSTLGTTGLVNGSASISRASLTVGNHTISASYNGDANFQPGYAFLTQAVSQASTTVVTSSANPASTNQPITLTATITGQYGGIPTGTVAFMQGTPAATWATAQLVNGQATVTTSFSKSGTYPITAVFLGSPDYQGSTSSVLNQVVSGSQNVTTTTALVSSGTPSIVNQPVVFTATVSPASGAIPNGETVTFYNGSNTLGSGTTANGVASMTTSSLPVGSNSITATYPGDSTYQSSTSRVFKQVVNLSPTTTSLVSSLNPSVFGQTVTFTVGVTPQSGTGTPTGTVTLKNGSVVIASITLSNGTGNYSTSVLAAGSSTITAAYSGDTNFSTSSATLTQVVSEASTTTTLTSTPNPSSLNQAVSFTATVTSAYGGKTSGTVTFTQGSTVLGNAAPVQGKATINYAFSATGTYAVVATYSGDVSNSGSASLPLSQSVGNTSTTTALTSSGSPSFAGQSVTFTATVTPSSGSVPNGDSVTFYDGSASLGTSTTKSGVATLVTSALAVGTHSISATYAGDATLQGSTSKIVKQVVNLNTSVTALASSANPSVYGQSITLTATVSASSGSLMPTGKVTFKNGTTAIASVALTNGTAAYISSTLSAGSLALSASYSGDGNFSTSTGTLTQVIGQAPTTTVLTSTPNPSSLNQNVTFSATVTAAYTGTISGSVSFLNGSKTLGSAPVTRGKATFTYAFTTVGTDSITAVYTGDANNQTSTSTPVAQTVTNAPTTTTVTSSNSSVPVAQPVTFTATVSSTYGPIPDGELVTFYDSTTTIGTSNTKSGAAAMTTSTLTAGVHNITATYAGDSTFESSTSKIFKQTISQAVTTTLLTSSANPSAYGQPITFTATVTSAGPTPTGTVTFKNGSAPLGTASLNPQGSATFTTLTLAAGTYAITAAYSGDTSSAKSTSATLNQIVNQAATTTQLISSVNPAAVGESVTFTAVVRSATAFATGSVTFNMGSTVLGSGSLVNGSAKVAVTTLPKGTETITATYTGSTNVAGSSGSMVQIVE